MFSLLRLKLEYIAHGSRPNGQVQTKLFPLDLWEKKKKKAKQNEKRPNPTLVQDTDPKTQFCAWQEVTLAAVCFVSVSQDSSKYKHQFTDRETEA